MSPAPSTTGRATLEELLSQEGLAPLRIGAEPSQSPVRVGGDPHSWGGSQIRWVDQWDPRETLFALDDVAKEREWESVHMEVGTAVHALTTTLSLLHDVVVLVGQV